MKFKNNIIFNFIVISIFLVINIQVFSATKNTKKLLCIQSDMQLLETKSNTMVFSGNVVVTQGAIKINADKVVVVNFYSKKDIINGYGNPIIFYHIQNNGKLVQGKALQIRYELAKGYVVLTGKAYISQFNNSINSDTITYLIKEQKVQAFSKGDKRVIMILVSL